MKELLFVFGGASPEYYPTCAYSASILEVISREKYNVHCVGVTQEGVWYLTEATLPEIADGESWIKNPGNKRAILSPDREDKGLIIFDGDSYKLQKIDVVFPFIMGETGEDGAIQGLLQLSGIPWAGSDVLSSSCGMDKGVSNIFAKICGFTVPKYYIISSKDVRDDLNAAVNTIYNYFKANLGENVFPLYVKPATTGSSIGISRVEDMGKLSSAMIDAAKYSKRLIIEQGISGRELKVAVLGNEEPICGEICEISVSDGMYNTFEMKYKSEGMHKRIPADLPEDIAVEVKRQAVEIYQTMGCSGFSRVDFFLTNDMKIVFNEINTEPGFGKKSIFSHMFEVAGIAYEDQVQKLIDSANI